MKSVIGMQDFDRLTKKCIQQEAKEHGCNQTSCHYKRC